MNPGHWLIHIIGVDTEAGHAYAFWSGFGSDLGEAALLGALLGVLRKHNCEVHHCWRVGRHATAAGHKVCRRHHPDDGLTAEQVLAAHEVAQRQQLSRRDDTGKGAK